MNHRRSFFQSVLGVGAGAAALAGISRAQPNPGVPVPVMTPDIADAILDYIDSNEDVRSFGVESDHYLGLSPPYRAKNGPLETVEELLLVKGVTPQLLFGQDVNRNFQIDPFEQDLPTGEGADPGDPSSAFGWLAYLTHDSA